jgi:nucleotide-binding universal stress UspA family protein
VPATPFRRILIGWDASAAASAALSTAVTIADGDGVVIARAVLSPPAHAETGGEHARDVAAQREWLNERFELLLRNLDTHGAHVRLEWGQGNDIPTDLCKSAEHHGCDLIILGRHGEENRLRDISLGHVARLAAERSALPVLLVSASP